MQQPIHPRSWFFPVCTAFVVIALGVGLYMAGSPQHARAQRYDQQRINDLQQITYSLDEYWNRSSNLPHSLEELTSTNKTYFTSSIHDPRTQTPYEYRVNTGSGNYELCATFETDTKQKTTTSLTQPYMDQPFWQHPMGRNCFSLQVRTLKPGTM